jgi:hypothetical protein
LSIFEGRVSRFERTAFFTARKNAKGEKRKIVRNVAFASGVPIRGVPFVMGKGSETLIAIRNLQRSSKPAETNTVNGFLLCPGDGNQKPE